MCNRVLEKALECYEEQQFSSTNSAYRFIRTHFQQNNLAKLKRHTSRVHFTKLHLITLWKNTLCSKKHDDGGNLLGEGVDLIADGVDLLAEGVDLLDLLLGDGGDHFGDGVDLLVDGVNLLGDGVDLLGDGVDLLGDGGDPRSIAVASSKTTFAQKGDQRLEIRKCD